jgi:hypothetical protein
MANENQTTSDSFWDRVEGATKTSSASAASLDTPTTPDPNQTVSHGFWDRVEGKKTPAVANSDVVMIGGQPVNLKTGVGAQQASVSQAQDATASQVKAPQGHVTSNPASVSPMAQGGYGMPGNVLPDIGTPERAAGTKMATTMGAAALAPVALPEMAGGGFLSYMGDCSPVRGFLARGRASAIRRAKLLPAKIHFLKTVLKNREKLPRLKQFSRYPSRLLQDYRKQN